MQGRLPRWGPCWAMKAARFSGEVCTGGTKPRTSTGTPAVGSIWGRGQERKVRNLNVRPDGDWRRGLGLVQQGPPGS